MHPKAQDKCFRKGAMAMALARLKSSESEEVEDHMKLWLHATGWCFDDAAVFAAEIVREVLSAHPSLVPATLEKEGV